MFKRIGAVLAVLTLSVLGAMAQSTAPVDLSGTGGDLVTWAGEAIAAGIGVFAVIIGLRVMKRVFRSAAG